MVSKELVLELQKILNEEYDMNLNLEDATKLANSMHDCYSILLDLKELKSEKELNIEVEEDDTC